MAMQLLNSSQGMTQPQIMPQTIPNEIVSENVTSEEVYVEPAKQMSLIEKEYNQIDIEHNIPTLANQFIEEEILVESKTASENQTLETKETTTVNKEVAITQTNYRNNLYQYGYNFFNHYSYFFPTNQTSIPDSYELQNGDRVTLIIYGKKEQVMDLVLDNQGDVILPNIGPVNLSGLTLDEANKKLAIQLRKSLLTLNQH